jgi:hypothetical protein
VARKRIAKKLKVTETTSQEVNSLRRVVEYLSSMLCMLTTKFHCLQEIPPSDPSDQGDEGDWETMEETDERGRSPTPAMTEVEPQAPVAEGRTEPAATSAAEEPTATEAEEEAPAEAGLVDITSILGTPTVTVVRSSL